MAFPYVAAAMLAGGALGFLGQRDSNRENVGIANRQMEFQANMSSTAYQRAVADMKAADLNPMLAYSQGGASSPGGAGAVMQNEMAAGVSSASQFLSMENMKAQTAKTEAETDLTRATIPKVTQDVDTSSAQAANLRQNTVKLVEEVKEVMAKVYQLHYQSLFTEEQVALARESIRNAVLTGENIKANTGNTKLDSMLMELDLPRARNMAESEKSWFKREVSPYLGDVRSGAGSVRSLRRPR